ncbi:hypothetical protein Barb4_02005 [Bacteroidales bacterium Barb4]|nr:hypothetical protein Barb4_02005 [Bacteroidales bacterium Barb4]
MHIVFGVAGDVEVDDQFDVGYVYSAGDNVGGDKDVHTPVLEVVHYLVPLRLVKVGVHGGNVEAHAFQYASQFFNPQFGGGEDDDTFRLALAEQLLQDGYFLFGVADVGGLYDGVGGAGDCHFHFHRFFENGLRQRAYFGRHGGGKHDDLTGGGDFLVNGEDVVEEAHVKHPVGFVQNEKGEAGEVGTSYLDVRQEPPRCGYHDVGTHFHAPLLLFPGNAVGAAIDGYSGDGGEVIGKAFDLLVDLLRQLAGGSHDDGVDGIGGTDAPAQFVDDGEDVGGGFPRSRLGTCDNVSSLKDDRDGQFLYGGGFSKIHSLDSVKYSVLKL